MWTSALFAAGAITYHAQAQASGDASLLSKPDDAGAINSSAGPNLPDNFVPAGSAPAGNAGDNSLPPPTPDWQKPANDRKEWTLMTPEEIMGVQTPEQIYGIPDKNKDLSPEQIYLNRREEALETAGTNGAAGDNSWSHKGLGLFDQPEGEDLFGNPDKQADSSSSRIFGGIYDKPQGSLFQSKAGNQTFGAPTHSSSTAKADAEEEAEMARFRALIGEVPAAGTASSSTPAPVAASPSLQPLSEFDPLGHSLINQTRDELSKPTGLTPLPELAGSYTPPKKPKRPSWAPQPPPWLSDGSTPPTTPPVRKFY